MTNDAPGSVSAVDVHSHAMPLPLLERLERRGLADLTGVDDEVVRLDPAVSGVGPRAPLPLARSQYDVVVRLSEMDADGDGRLAGLGSVPLGWPGAATEAGRCLDDMGMAGVAIGSRGAGRELDDPVNDDLWALLAERRTFVFLHPSGVPDAHRQRDFWLPQLVGYPMETALAVARLVFGGVLERFSL